MRVKWIFALIVTTLCCDTHALTHILTHPLQRGVSKVKRLKDIIGFTYQRHAATPHTHVYSRSIQHMRTMRTQHIFDTYSSMRRALVLSGPRSRLSVFVCVASMRRRLRLIIWTAAAYCGGHRHRARHKNGLLRFSFICHSAVSQLVCVCGVWRGLVHRNSQTPQADHCVRWLNGLGVRCRRVSVCSNRMVCHVVEFIGIEIYIA